MDCTQSFLAGRPMKRSLFPSLLLRAAALATVGGVRAHDLPHVFQEYPKPPPVTDPGPDAALLRVRIVDAVTRDPMAATVSVNNGEQEPDDDPYRKFGLRFSANRQKGPIRSRPISYYFYTDGRFTVRVPPGGTLIEVRKGYEYRPVELTIAANPKEQLDVEVPLERSIDMAALGWYSGDTHIHLERTRGNDDELLTLTSAKDIRYAYLLSTNTQGYDVGGPKYESYLQAAGLGDLSVAHRGPYYISSGQEYRANGLGHVTIALPDRYVPGNGDTPFANRGPALATIADQAHELHGFIGLAHGGLYNMEGDRLLLEDKMDYLELLQFGSFQMNSPARRNDASLGLSGWYDFLNIGYRLPIIGASDFPFTRELASEMTFAWSDTVPTPRSFAEALKAGRSFATSGPLLFLTVAGKKPGEILRFPAGTETSLVIDVRVHSPQYPVRYLDLIANGAVLERRFEEAGRSEWALRHVLPIRGSTWIAVHAYNDAGTEAHTNPVYVYVGDARPFNPDSARQIIARLEGSIERSRVPEIKARYEALEQELRGLIRDRRANLPLPRVTP
jgi:hypothetical protein